MNRTFLTKERRYLLIIGGVLLLAALLYRFFPGGGNFSFNSPDTELKQEQIARYISIVQQKPLVEKQIIYLNKVYNDLSRVFLNGNTPALAAVDIQNTLNKITEKVNTSIKRIDIIKEKKIKDQELISVPVRFTMESTTSQLRDVLFFIESSEKLLRISDVQLNVRTVKYPELIVSTITVEGFIHE